MTGETKQVHGRNKSVRRWITWAIVFIVLAATAIWLLPELLVDWAIRGSLTPPAASPLTGAEKVKAVTDARQSVLLAVGGVIAVITLLLTVARHNLTLAMHNLDKDANWTNRYTEAIKQLGDESSFSIRLGGIYALERIAQDSPRDRQTILDVLCAYLRGKSPARNAAGEAAASMTTDTAAAITVVSRITQLSPPTNHVNLGGTNLTDANLNHAHLNHAHLNDAHLNDAHLNDAHLNDAHLNDAHLTYAYLTGAELTRADLTGADLTGAELTRARLTRAHLTRADLTGAELTNAHLNDAYLTEADFTGAHLTYANLNHANLHGTNLNHAHLNDAHLNHADLTKADLTKADLTKADLTGAYTIELDEMGRRVLENGRQVMVLVTRTDLAKWSVKGLDSVKGLPAEKDVGLPQP